MNYPWMNAYLLDKPGVEKDFKPEWDCERYRVGEKMFAYVGGDKSGRPIITLKLDPGLSVALRGQYPEVVPGYYANKLHWSSLYLDGAGEVPEETVRAMLDNAYALILAALPKKRRMEIEESAKGKERA